MWRSVLFALPDARGPRLLSSRRRADHRSSSSIRAEKKSEQILEGDDALQAMAVDHHQATRPVFVHVRQGFHGIDLGAMQANARPRQGAAGPRLPY
jgi:hypothetical protein